MSKRDFEINENITKQKQEGTIPVTNHFIELSNAERISFLSETTIKMLEPLSSERLFSLVAERLYSISGGAIISFSEFDPDNKKIIVRELLCSENEKEQFIKILGREAKGLVLDFPESLKQRIIPGHLDTINGGLSELVFDQLPVEACKEIEENLKIAEIYAMACSVKDEIYGTVSIIMTDNDQKKIIDKALIESIVNQAALVFKRNKTEENLSRSEEKFSAIFNSNYNAQVLSKMEDGTIIEANNAFYTLFERTKEEVIGKTSVSLDMFVNTHDRERAIKILKTNGSLKDFELKIKRKSGEERIALLSVELLQLTHGKLMLTTIQDISQNRLIEENLRRSEEEAIEKAMEIEAILGCIADGIIVYDKLGRIVRLNAMAKETLNLQETDKILTFHERTPNRYNLITDDGHQLRVEEIPAFRATILGEIVTNNILLAITENQRKWINVSAAPLIVNGVHTGGIMSISDVSQIKSFEQSLARERELFEGIFNNIPVMITIYDPDLKNFRFNNEFKKNIGWTEEDAADANFMSKVYPDPDYRQKVIEYMQSLEKGWKEWIITTKDGRQIETSWANVLLTSGIQIGIGIDIRERKQTEKALKKSNEYLRSITDNSPDVIARFNKHLQHTFINPYGEKVYGKTRDKIIGKTNAEIGMPEEKVALWNEHFRKAFSTGLQQSVEFDFNSPAFGYQLFLSIFVPEKDDKGEVVSILAITRDITSLKYTEERLRESEERFRTLADNIAPFVWMANEKGNIFWYSKRWYEYTGANMEEMEYWGWLNLVQPEHVERVKKTYNHAIATGERWQDIFPLQGKDGTYRWYISRALPIKDNNGNIVRWFGSNSDITDLKEAQEELTKNEQRLKAMFNNAAIGIIETDHYDHIIDVNEQLLNILGYSHREELICKTISELTSPEDRIRSDEMNSRLHKGDFKKFKYEKKYLKKDGTPIWVNVTVSAILDSQGNYINSIGTVEDISERKQYEEALKKSEESLRLVIEAAELGTWDFDFETENLEHSHRHDIIYGYTEPQKDWTYLSSLKHMLPEFVPVINEAYNKALETGTLRFESKIKWPDGSIHWIAPYGRISFNSEGKPIRMAGIIADITERKTAEEAVKESEEMFSAMFHSLPIGTSLSTYPDEKLTNVNKAWLDLAEISDINEVLGKTKLELGLIKEEDINRIKDEFNQFGNVRNAETVFISKKGVYNIININMDIIQINGQKYILSTNEDITDQKKNEQEIKQKNEELTRFIYTVSHDLKSPLVTIKSFTSYLKEDIESNDKTAQDKDIGYIENAADKMGRLLDELLELSRIGRKEEPKTEITLENVTKMALDLVAGRLSQKNVKVSIAGPPVMLYGFTQRFIQLFQNLIDNAVKFMGEQQEPIIEIGAYQDNERNDVVIFVRDNGSGIDQRYHHKIFGLFEKMDNKTEGSGIGLALVKRIVEVHEGSIWFESEGTGKGTTFYFTLKRTRLLK